MKISSINFTLSLSLTLLFFSFIANAQLFYPEFLTCEYLDNPIGIDAEKPRFSWKIVSNKPRFKQTAYEILVGEDSLLLQTKEGIVWSSGKINSDKTLTIYNGEKLKPRTRYYWTVSIWDEDNNKSSSKHISNFETGKLDEVWQAQWISDGTDTLVQQAPYFRKEIMLEKKIVSARIYITAAGLFEVYLNGTKVGDDLLNPMFTRFDKRNLYLTYDVTSNIHKGNNIIGVILGNGWYNHQSWSEWDFHKAIWRNRPAFCMEMHIKYADGTSETVYSNNRWKTTLGPITFNSIYTGEHYDARKELLQWNTTEYNDEEWNYAITRDAPSSLITTQTVKPIRITDEFNHLEFIKINDSTYLYILPENIAGISKFMVQGESGTTFRIKHGETIDENNKVDQSTISIYCDQKNGLDPFQTDIFILKGKGLEEFTPRFNYKGFQYVEVEADRPIELNSNNLIAYRVNNDVRAVGKIESSNELVNKIWAATNRSYLSNLQGYPTDCPHREKNGWTGDAHIVIETALFNYDAITIYEKWLADHRDAQLGNGILPAIIPTSTWGYSWGNGVDWTSSMIIIPWTLYLYYGDTRPLSQNYTNMKRFLDYVSSISPNGLTDWGLGDWAPYKSIGNKELLISLYYYHDALILSKTARILGYDQDFLKYNKLAMNIKHAINDKFLDKEKGIYATGSQSELSCPLYWGIVPDEYKQKVADNLAKRVIEDNKHVDIGLLGSKTLLGALSDNGYAELAFEVATQRTCPSWGWWIQNGATTLFETWKIETETLSRNHVMFGEINAWFFITLGGINVDENNPGFINVVVKPHFVRSLNNFKAEYDSINGLIISSWKRINNLIVFDLTIPANCSASLYLDFNISANISGKEKLKQNKDGSYQLGSGHHQLILNENLH